MATIPFQRDTSETSLRARFVVTVFAGSFLLFLVQPMVARMALPRLGGAPAVWNSAMLVYQALLLAGYAYAHWLGRLAPRRQSLVHLSLFALAALTLPIALISAVPGPDANIFTWVPWLLLVSIGPLFLVISAQAPLMQRWFALAGGGDPYPLYAASNFGSFLGLLAYPLLVEPLLSINDQSRGWSFAYAALALLVAACALRLPKTVAAGHAAAELTPRATVATARPSRAAIGRWILLSAIPSGLMLSTSLHLTTNIVAMPLLWVLPLGLYLLSYSVAFATRRGPAATITRLAPYLLLAAGSSVCSDETPFPLVIAATALLCLFAVAVALHARLFEQRPDPEHLTIFYLSTSVGGVLGGLLCALIAPLSFDWTYEHPLLLAAAGAVIVGVNPFARIAALWDGGDRARRLARWLGIAVLLLSLVGNGAFGTVHSNALAFAASTLIIAVAIVSIGNRLLFTVALCAMMLSMGGWGKLQLSWAHQMTRSFFGVDTVRALDGNAMMLVHGNTAHGVQNLGSPQREMMVTTYYAPLSGVGLAMAAVPSIFPDARVAVVGLGAGTLSCTSVPGQRWRFYEIDSRIAEIARRDFTFLGRCQPDAGIVIGDARLTLEREAAASADVLVIDAFSSDTVPMHLLTLEAFDVYRRHLRPDGLLMVHISNRYIDLTPVIAAAAAHGWDARIRTYWPSPSEKRDHAVASRWVAMSPSATTIAAVERASGTNQWWPMKPTGAAAWTDDHSSILPLINWRG